MTRSDYKWLAFFILCGIIGFLAGLLLPIPSHGGGGSSDIMMVPVGGGFVPIFY